MKIALFDAKPYDRFFFDAANRAFRFQIDYLETRLNIRSASLAQGYDVVCAFVNDELDAAVMAELARRGVRLVAMRCAGYNNVDLNAAWGKLRVVRVPAYSPHAVAEYTLALLLTLNRKTHRAFNRVRENNFSIHGLLGIDLFQRTAGIIGTGKIGRTVAGIFAGLGMNVLGYDRFPDPQAAETYHFRYVPLQELYRKSDVISLHCPLTSENEHMINAQSINLMKIGVILLNTSRGKLIDTTALIDGLKSGRLGGAGLDVYEEEAGYFYEDRSDRAVDDDLLARLLTFPNVIVTSHQAFFTEDAMIAIARTTLNNIRDFAAGDRLNNEVCQRCGSQSG